MPRQGVKGQSQMTDIKHVCLIEYLGVGMFKIETFALVIRKYTRKTLNPFRCYL